MVHRFSEQILHGDENLEEPEEDLRRVNVSSQNPSEGGGGGGG